MKIRITPTSRRKGDVNRKALPPFLPPFLDIAGSGGVVAVLVDGDEEDGGVLVKGLLRGMEGGREKGWVSESVLAR